jgi:DNA-binding Xre family transcriptional regulator
MISYKPLFRMMFEKDMRKTDLVRDKIISAPTLSKLSKNETVNSEIQDKLCAYFGCRIQDIMEYVPETSGETV